MKTIPQKVNAVKRVYASLDKEIASFQKKSGLNCLSGCGECCKKPDIEATPIEFLPLALQFLDEGRAEEAYDAIQASDSSLCYVFRPHVTSFGGMCNEYPNRGLICRLFGFTARKDKEGNPELVTCKLIKEQQANQYHTTLDSIKNGEKVPVMSNYYSRMIAVDPALAQFYPINQAMAKALEIVMAYYAYRKRRAPKSTK